MNDLAYDEDARWLQSDGSIIGKVHRTKDPQGIRLSLDIPLGEPVVAVVEKLNAASMTIFCNMARDAYNERKAEQIATAERGSRDAEERKGREELDYATPVQAVQTTVVVNPMDPESVSRRLIEIAQRVGDLSEEIRKLDTEGNVLLKILEVLSDAQKDDGAPDDSLQTTTPSPNEGEGAVSTVDIKPCEDQLLQTGQADPERSNSGLADPLLVQYDGGEVLVTPVPGTVSELASPDADAEGGSVDHNN